MGRHRSHRRRPSPHQVATIAAAAAVVLFAAVSLRNERRASDDARKVARHDVLPVSTLMAGEDARTLAEGQGLERYSAGRYGEAVSSLLHASQSDSATAQTFLYLGSAQMLAGRDREAMRSLTIGMRLAVDSRLMDEIRWQLANAQLAIGDRRGAVRNLRSLSDSRSLRQEDALGALDRLGARPGELGRARP